MKVRRNLTVLAAAAMMVGLGQAKLMGQSTPIVVDGTLDAAYGAPIVTQTIDTSFGDSTIGDGTSGGGSELDAGYATVQGGTLYLMFTGNFENGGNHIDVFIDDGRGGPNTLNAVATSPPALNSMNGSVFAPGFNPTYALDANDYNNTLYLNTYALLPPTTGGYAGSVAITSGIGSGTLTGIQIGLNNTNAAGIVGNTGTNGTIVGAAADPAAADAVTTGLEFGIPLSLLGDPTGSVSIMADINGNNDNYLSNQFLPGLPASTGSLGDGKEANSLAGNAGGFNFSSDSNEYFTVAVPATTGNWINGTGSGSWSDTGSWSGGVVPNGSGATANFSNPAGGAVTVDGPYTVGTLTFNSPAAAPYLLMPDGNGDALTLSNTTGDAAITDFGGTHIIQTNLLLASNTDVTVVNNGDQLEISGNISGPGALSVTNPGGYNGSLLILAGSNTYTGGTIINSGELQLNSSTALPANSAITFNASDVPDPTLDLDGNSVTVSSITSVTGPNTPGTGSIGQIINTSTTASATFTYAGSPSNPSTFFGALNGTTAGSLSLVVASGSLTINGSSSYQSNPVPASFTGSTTIDSGATLTLSAATNTITVNGTPVTIVGGNTLSQSSSITNNGTLNIDDFEAVGQITNNGMLTIGAGGTMQLRASTGTITYANSGLTLNGGKIDVTNNELVLTYMAGNDPISAIRADFTAGDIISSTASLAAGTSVGYADGSTDSGTAATGNEILIRYTWLGDLNLDGQVTTADFNTLTANLGNTNADWAQGDLNYDGRVNADDVSLFMLGAAEAGSSIIPVPEPAALTMLALPLLGLRRRRIAMA